MHYSQDNSYINQVIESSHYIDTSKLSLTKVIGWTIINFNKSFNYYYFYLKEGVGIINGLHFSGTNSSLIVYSDDSSKQLNVSSLSDYMEYYYWNETKKNRIQNIIDFSHGGKFIIEKDFPYEFYSIVDGTKDITFNIEFLKLEFNELSDTPQHLFEINAYILNENEIQNLELSQALPRNKVYNGFYDNDFSLGKIVIKKGEISTYLSSTYKSYVYIIVTKIGSNSNIIYNHVEGNFIFFSMDYIYSSIPEDFYISSFISLGQKSPHLYTLEGKNITIQFFNSGDELDCKILKYQIYPTGSEDLYIDNDQYVIQRREDNNRTYIDVTQEGANNTTFNKIILSIYPKNEGNLTGLDNSISYTLKYNTHPFIPKIIIDIPTDIFTTDIFKDNFTENVTAIITYNETVNETENIEYEDTTIMTVIPSINQKASAYLLGFANYIY